MTTEIERRPAAAVSPRSPSALSGRVIPRGTAVATRDTITHGDWVRNATQVIQALELIGHHQQAMLSGLTAANASRSQIADVRRWSDTVSIMRQVIYDGLVKADLRLARLIDAVEAAGGVEEVADAGYFVDV